MTTIPPSQQSSPVLRLFFTWEVEKIFWQTVNSNLVPCYCKDVGHNIIYVTSHEEWNCYALKYITPKESIVLWSYEHSPLAATASYITPHTCVLTGAGGM